MKKVFGQTVRDIKREVNKKVLKVPGIEQKVLDATSNEPWGPHGSLLADIAHATRNYHEYQMIMAVIWKRINDTGKNWRHVYKALTVLEYLVAHGSERIIDEIKEHAYQISALSDFQYIDSSGRDQGSNVRKKSQNLVVLVNDKERIVEVRQKAAENRDKFRNTSYGGMHRPGSYSSEAHGDRYDDDRVEGRYGSRDEDRNGYDRERDWGRDDDRYGRNWDSYGRDGKDNEDRYSRDGSRDDDYRGRSRTIDDYQHGSRSKSSDRDRDNTYNDDGQYSSRGSGAKADDHPQNGRGMERKFSEQNIGAPPSYEEAVSDSQSPVHSERDGETSAASIPRGSSPPPVSLNPVQATTAATGNAMSSNPGQATTAPAGNTASANEEVEAFDEFDPRAAVSVTQATSNNVEMDLLGSLSESFSSNALALMPATSATTGSGADANFNGGSATTFAATSSASSPFEDPFGDSPFKAIPSSETAPSQQQTSTSTDIFQPAINQSVEPPQPGAPKMDTVSNFGFGETLSGLTYDVSSSHPPTSTQFLSQEFSTPPQDIDILADILPPAPLPTMTAQLTFTAASGQADVPSFSPSSMQPTPTAFSASTGQLALPSFSVPTGQTAQQPFSAPPGQPAQQSYSAPPGQPALQAFSSPTSQHMQQAFSAPTIQTTQPTFFSHSGQPLYSNGNIYSEFHPQPPQPQAGHISTGNFLPQGSMLPVSSRMAPQTSAQSNYFPHQGGSTPITSHTTTQTLNGPVQFNNGKFHPQQGATAPVSSHVTQQKHLGPGENQNSDVLSSLLGQSGTNAANALQHGSSSSTGSLSMVPQPSKDKFETKSTVWADTLSRGLVNLNISGSKTNPLADIGIDFEAINRKEKRMEKPAANPVISTVTMGKAMGSGSGIGRAGAGAGAIRPPPNHMMGLGMGMGMGMGGGSGAGMGMGGYGGMNPSMGMAVGTNMGMGMGMNVGMGQGVQMQQPTGLPPGTNMSGNYNPMMGSGGYAPQQPYGGGYR
ncbi:Clathrin interactor EPSIN like [Quillaja saponaria]|uniref:Clathrin interactor EPSIN like n=1 Tax=Quillaja saponaria TaxID=32244 RepID=A0AAD7LFS0_QUISA|nr:Clathrin interactor EPSIN like [Quillaja saponaria]KAJ7957369.1 Clathrin interactor EPSIN like [Quillaja saponaria]